jgi:acyl carrier protein phosphodiesterase
MNFLAHFHLAWPSSDLIAGGLEGDYFKGPVNAETAPVLARGIQLHRTIDAYTDAHPVVVEVRRQFPAHLRRYSGILIDLAFDHYLTLHWSQFSALPLADFNAVVYQVLQSNESQLSPGSAKMMNRLLEYDILNRYHRWHTVTATAARIGQRFRRGNPFLNLEQLDSMKTTLERAFIEFYPQLQIFSAETIALTSKTP